MRQTSSDIGIGLGLLLFCGFATWRTLGIRVPPEDTIAGTSFLPWIMIGGIALMSLILIGRALLRLRRDENSDIPIPEKATFMKMGLFTILMVAYAALFMTFGYIPTTLVVFIVGLILFQERRIPVLILFPVLMTGLIYLGFTRILNVWLP